MTPLEKAEAVKNLPPIVKAAFVDIREGLVSQLESGCDKPEEVTLKLVLLKEIQNQFQRYIRDQTIEEHKARHDSWIQKMTERAR